MTLQPDGRRYHILVPLAPGFLLNQRELRCGVAAFVPASGRLITLGGTEQASVAVLHAGPGLTSCLSARPAGQQ